ncbi:DUF305 domain-containing protein [[Pseudomonas] carboxydohydrogena]|uniref:DUF305 domain-containing protein n=1 Tax=Afipia carboxydohydrogena TaxID=290 RepID=A0ABY8BKB5_AFICR|nr:DUF305 domain-containing protein [[Pseudomonas] carboxydohydrogena]WEF50407.1 DUF305 domain-containing protein [[Pseudomonas] carboxydohydrogena]
MSLFPPHTGVIQLVAAIGFAIGPICSHAQTTQPQAQTDQASLPVEAEQPFLTENSAAMDKMMAGMDVKPTGDVDADFTAMMIPHHQGAIDMAVAYLRYGHNEQLRRIAQEIIVDQQQEIAAMRLALGQPLPADAAVPTQATAATAPAPSHHNHSFMSPGMMMSPLNKTK